MGVGSHALMVPRVSAMIMGALERLTDSWLRERPHVGKTFNLVRIACQLRLR